MFLLLFVTFLCSCVSSAKHKKVSEENLRYREQLKKTRIDLSKAYQQLKKQSDSILLLQNKEAELETELKDLRTFAKYEANGISYLDSVSFLSEEEKNTLFYLNMVRMYPQIFVNAYLLPFIKEEYGENTRNLYVTSLLLTLKQLKPLAPLKPNRELFELAKCHAITSGKTGYYGHNRHKSCKKGYFAECCSYGEDDGLGVVCQLLIDNGVESLGHRNICLGKYANVGISMQAHTKYGVNTVLDFN